jgi:tRNA-splicing ligase RtcB (3'-phosphate/5'-hydroxy nucleic acid ligase)
VPCENNIRIYGEHDDATLAQLNRCMRTGSAVAGVLCADGHLGYAHPIGGVIAYERHISVSGVGYDIACGNMAVKLDLKIDEIRPKLGTIATDIAQNIAFGLGRKNQEKVDHELFDSDLWVDAGAAHLKDLARSQLGTVGSGNHYIDVFHDENDFVWIGVHFGSRGLGHKLTTDTLKTLRAKADMHSEPALIAADTMVGDMYMARLQLAGQYAYAGREWVIDRVQKIIGGAIGDEIVHNHHNYCWIENHYGAKLYVVRKGATPAWPGQLGFVGGSMGDNAYIIRGKTGPKEALASTIHGAGRVMGRLEAKGRLRRDPATGEKRLEPGRINPAEWRRWMTERNVILVGGGLDEAPQVYRRLNEVIKYHEDTIDIVHTLRPLVVLMAGEDVRDPYKD